MKFRVPYINVCTAVSIKSIKGGYEIISADGEIRRIQEGDLIFVEELSVGFRVSYHRRIDHNVDLKVGVKPSTLIKEGDMVKTLDGRLIHFKPPATVKL